MRLPVLLFLLATSAFANPFDDHLRRAEAFGFSGQVLIERDGRVLLHRAYGLADIERARPVTQDTAFGIASMSKQFCAAAIVALQDDGKLRLDDPLDRHFENVPVDKAKITIDQLLAHSSGLPPGDLVDDFTPLTHEQLVAKILAAKLVSAPGEKWNYSNAGYNLLAAIVEKRSGRDYATFLRDRFFQPLGMTRTGVIGVDRFPLAAVAYRGFRPQGGPATWPENRRVFGAGDIASTVGDLHKWELALRAGRVVSSPELFRKRIALEGNDAYAAGWFVGKTARGHELIEHGGDTEMGFNGVFLRYPSERAVILILSNRSEVNEPSLRHTVQADLDKLLFGDEPAPLPAVRGDGATGTYVAADCSTITIRRAGPLLLATAEGDLAVSALWGSDRASMHVAVARTTMLLRALLAGDAAAAYREPLRAEADRLVPEYAGEWNRLVAKHGALRGFSVHGAIPRRRGTAVRAFATLDFERASIAMAFAWAEDAKGRLAGTSVGEGAPLARFVAPSDAGLLAMNLFASTGVPMKVAADRITIGGDVFVRARYRSGPAAARPSSRRKSTSTR